MSESNSLCLVLEGDTGPAVIWAGCGGVNAIFSLNGVPGGGTICTAPGVNHRCLSTSMSSDPSGGDSTPTGIGLQEWAKPMPDGGVAVLVCTPSHSRGARAPYRYWLLKNAIRALPIEILSREAGFTAKRVCKCAIRIRDVFQQVLNNRDPLAANVSIAIDLVEVTEVSHGRGYIGPCQSTWAC